MKFVYWILGIVLFVLLLLIVKVTGRANSGFAVFLPNIQQAGSRLDKVEIPKASDWVDYGTILTAGAEGAWDHLLFGGFAATAIKKDDVYYLYYQGVEDYSDELESVTRRAIGVATSLDGINFTKYNGNPVLTWFPTGHLEEGAVSSGATVVGDEIYVYYGANKAESPTTINADGRLAISGDGINFVDQGIALNHKNPSIWGSGDELFPIITIHEGGQWFVYYLPNGTPEQRELGVAWGSNPLMLKNSTGTLSGRSPIKSWGTGGYAQVDQDTFALFLNNVPNGKTDVRIVSLNTPELLGAPVESYQFEDFRQATVLLDRETNTWFMYYRNGDQSRYGVKLAPAGKPDITPPTAPVKVAAVPVSANQVDLSWDPGTDSETGIVLYKVYRDGVHVASVKGWHYTDTNLDEKNDYSYEVSAVNYHGLESARSTKLQVTSLVDFAIQTQNQTSFFDANILP